MANELIKKIKEMIIQKLKKNGILGVCGSEYIKVGLFGAPRIEVQIDKILVKLIINSNGFGRKTWDEIEFTIGNIVDPNTDIEATVDKCINFLIEFNQLLSKYDNNHMNNHMRNLIKLNGKVAIEHIKTYLTELGYNYEDIFINLGTLSKHLHDHVALNDGKSIDYDVCCIMYKDGKDNLYIEDCHGTTKPFRGIAKPFRQGFLEFMNKYELWELLKKGEGK